VAVKRGGSDLGLRTEVCGVPGVYGMRMPGSYRSGERRGLGYGLGSAGTRLDVNQHKKIRQNTHSRGDKRITVKNPRSNPRSLHYGRPVSVSGVTG